MTMRTPYEKPRITRALDLSGATVEDTARRLAAIERGAVHDRHWCMVDVGMRLAWLSARGAPAALVDPLVLRFRRLEGG